MIKVASLLTEPEMNRVKHGLDGLRIKYFVSGRGTVPGEYNDEYFEVSVNPTDYAKAKSIVNQVRSKSQEENKKCPKCKSAEYRILEKKNLWERLIYIGATRVECKKCRARYVVW